MLNVFLTVDVELWPDSWDLSPRRFSEYFRRYIHGSTATGDYGLPFQLRLLAEHDLKGVFFVESLFACEFGIESLREIVGLIRGAKQEVQAHLHTEWVGHSTNPILPGRKGMYLREFTQDEQTFLIGKGLDNLRAAGVEDMCAFRAGSFGANRATLRALAANQIAIDSSGNAAYGVAFDPKVGVWQPGEIEGVNEYPVTVYRDWPRGLRHAQVGSCGFGELSWALLAAHEADWHSAVVFWHSAELLNRTRARPDPIAIRRFENLCAFLAANRQRFNTRWFSEVRGNHLPPPANDGPLPRHPLATLRRHSEQLMRRVFVG